MVDMGYKLFFRIYDSEGNHTDFKKLNWPVISQESARDSFKWRLYVT